ncbi:MAG: Na+/H+ antiporter NhaA [Bacteroidota bacterium]|nr:Na+/H+ antiporter NhaA [Bacteroidota bacterium]
MVFRKILIDPIKSLIEHGRMGGILLILATILSVFVSNSASGSDYIKIWDTHIRVFFLDKSILRWINDALMPLFFLLVGIEIKRELVTGELSRFKQAILPVIAALGGMIAPAVIFFIFNSGHPESIHGWAIPTATDIAFSLGVLSLMGDRVPFSLKVFLTALAIIDDLGAIVIIAIFYAGELHPLMFLFSALVLLAIFLLKRLKVKWSSPYLLLGVLLWYFIMKSGIHSTIAGVLLAMIIPSSLAEKLENQLNMPVYYLILPLFALSNTAIPLSGSVIGQLFSPVGLGIILGLIIGKPLGIVSFSWVMVKAKWSEMPQDASWKQMISIGMTAGIGFTMSIFVASLSFSTVLLTQVSKLAVFTGSLISAIFGIIALYLTLPKNKVCK